MTKILRFKIGEAFPADDPVARFATVLAMASNDWLRSFKFMEEIEGDEPEDEALRIMLFRQQLALHYEAANFIVTARKRFPEIEEFIGGLEQQAKDFCDRVTAGIDPNSEHYLGDWLKDHRNVTFHYAEMHPQAAENDDEEISEALKAAAIAIPQSTIETDEQFKTVRFRFADEVAVQWLPDVDKPETITAAREAVEALAAFAQIAVGDYLLERHREAVTLDET